jgi:hypothetical protein
VFASRRHGNQFPGENNRLRDKETAVKRALQKWFGTITGSRCGRRSFQPQIESLEDRRLMTSMPVTPPHDLQDPLVAPVAQAEFVQEHGHLSRMDVIHLLEVVAGTKQAVFQNGQVSFVKPAVYAEGTLTGTQLGDLRTLVTDAGLWGLTPDLTNLLDNTIGYNPANMHYDHDSRNLVKSGQLAPGSPSGELTILIGKWFYGIDVPDAAQAAKNNNIPDNVVYASANGTLFGAGGPSAQDIGQGWLPDCYFLSALGEVATQSPQTIENMFIDNGDGTYAVRFFEYDSVHNEWNPVYVTVNRMLPVLKQSGQFAFADWYQGGSPVKFTDTSAALWPALAEKAYAQLAEEGWSRGFGPSGSGGSNNDVHDSYDDLSYGYGGVACQQLSGWNNAYSVNMIPPSKKETPLQVQASAHNEAALAQAFSQGSLVIFGSPNPEPAVPTDANGVPLVIGNHAYMVMACDLANDQFTLVNPYDDSSAYKSDGQRTITLTWRQLSEYFVGYDVVSPPSLVANSHVAPQSVEPILSQLIVHLSQVQPGDPVESMFTNFVDAPRTAMEPTVAREIVFASELARGFMTGGSSPVHSAIHEDSMFSADALGDSLFNPIF